MLYRYKLVLMCALALAFATCIANESMDYPGATGRRDHIIKALYEDGSVDLHTCRRVKEFDKDTVSQEECKAKLSLVNDKRIALVRENVPENINEKQAKLFAKIIMTCPIAKILQYPYSIEDGRLVIDFPGQ